MAGSSVIGALRVDLGLNSAQFSAGLKDAQGALGKFGTVAARGFTAVAAAATVAAGALALATGRAIKHADALNKASQQAGVAVEALSRLEYAAKFSDISLEQLTGGLQKLSRAMVEAAQNGGSQAASAFAALGVSIRDSAGNLRDTDAVFSDLSGVFSQIEDGAVKTSLAIRLFGKSGAELLPLLNEGADGLARYGARADELGVTISGATAAAADKFGDTLDDVSEILGGVVNQVMAAALPALQSLADTLASPEFAEAAKTLATNIISALNLVVQAVTATTNAISSLMGDPVMTTPYSGADKNNAMSSLRGQLGSHASNPWRRSQDPASFYSGFGFTDGQINVAQPGASKTGPDLSKYLLDLEGVKAAQQAANAETQMFNAMLSDMQPFLEGTQDPFAELQSNLDKLGALLNEGKIDWETYGAAVVKVQANMVAGVAGLAGQLTGALGQIFEDNKAIAVAGAIVNGIESVSKTLATYGATPWGFAAAAIAGTTAALNVANILSTTKTSKSMPGTSGGGSAAAASAQMSSAINLTIRGSGNINVDDFADQLTQSIADGGNQNLVKVIRAA